MCSSCVYRIGKMNKDDHSLVYHCVHLTVLHLHRVQLDCRFCICLNPCWVPFRHQEYERGAERSQQQWEDDRLHPCCVWPGWCCWAGVGGCSVARPGETAANFVYFFLALLQQEAWVQLVLELDPVPDHQVKVSTCDFHWCLEHHSHGHHLLVAYLVPCIVFQWYPND